MELIERVEQLERELKQRRPELHFPSTATLEHRIRWLEIVQEEIRARDNQGVYAETLDEEKLKRLLAHTVYIKSDRITLHSFTADPASCVAGDMWFRSDLKKAKLAEDAVVANAKEFTTPAGVALLGSDTTERSTTSTADDNNLSSVTGLNIAVDNPILVLVAYRRVTTTTNRGVFGLKLNTTVVLSTGAAAPLYTHNTPDGGESGYIRIWIGPRLTNYARAGMVHLVIGGPWSHGIKDSDFYTADMPIAAITSITITGKVEAATVTLYTIGMRVYNFPI